VSVTVEIDKSLSLEEQYTSLVSQIKSLLSKEDELISNLANLVAVLFYNLDKISWVGFYLFDGKKLYVGPFQGNVACTSIEIGKGVCGTAAEDRKTIIVEDVGKFPGHIYCDPESKSEMVIPLEINNKLFGVLDLDSTQYSAFDETDRKFLEEICTFLIDEIINII
jgi:GAF domain-containing protein